MLFSAEIAHVFKIQWVLPLHSGLLAARIHPQLSALWIAVNTCKAMNSSYNKSKHARSALHSSEPTSNWADLICYRYAVLVSVIVEKFTIKI